MSSLSRAVRPVVAIVAAVCLGVLVPVAVGMPSASSVSEPCINGVWPLNPYVANCNLGPRPPRVLGSAPDAGALIACRGNKQCLSLYVNGGYGWYPGAILVPGYHP